MLLLMHARGEHFASSSSMSARRVDNSARHLPSDGILQKSHLDDEQYLHHVLVRGERIAETSNEGVGSKNGIEREVSETNDAEGLTVQVDVINAQVDMMGACNGHTYQNPARTSGWLCSLLTHYSPFPKSNLVDPTTYSRISHPCSPAQQS